MLKKILMTLVTFTLLIHLTPLTTFVTTVNASSTIHVDPGQSIQEAIDSAQPGDTVIVHAGFYRETVRVTKSLTLLGESAIIDGDEANRTVVEVIASNVAISGFTVQNTSRAAGTSYAGIKILGQSCNVTANHVTKTKIGIFVTSQHTRIVNNTATNNGHGIALYSSSNTTIRANNVSANTIGISIALSNNNIIEDNTARNSSTGGHGMTLQSNSYNNTIRQNNLIYNYHGMWLSSSSDNKIINNTIAFNKLLGVELASSSNNTFIHNNFINNPKHIVIDGSTNTWEDTPSARGNFWDDYGQLDIDGNGVGDSIYTINPNNQDRYPATTPQRPIPITWNATIYPTQLRSNSTISQIRFITTQRTISFNVTGPNYTTGFCNITLPNKLVQDLWQNNFTILVAGTPPLTTQNFTDGSNTYIHFTYDHSERQIEIVSEFPLAIHTILIFLLLVLTIIAVTKQVKAKNAASKS